MPKTFLITGATGLIGGYLTRRIIQDGDNYIAITRNPEAAAGKLKDAKKILSLDSTLSLKNEEIHAVINLAGSNLGAKRWTQSAKKDFYDSRINITNSLVELFRAMPAKPEVFVSASGVDYYGDTGSKEMFEDAPPAKSFLGKLTNDWELAALKAETLRVRTVILRTGLVMAKDSEAIKKLILPVKMFVGGPLGSGKQYVSWIHIDDLVDMYVYAVENSNIRGIYNAAAPYPETNAGFIKHAAKLLSRPAFAQVPAFMLKAVLGEMSAVVLDGRRAVPKKIVDAGFKFRFEHDTDAWRDILKVK